MMFQKCRIAAAALITMTALFVLPADAAARKQKQVVTQQGPSLDGRVTGQPRTCGYDMMQYDPWGVPRGPYCH